jgi:DtxR family Mn-dependent transcriptional regulator
MPSITEENYLKALLRLGNEPLAEGQVGTNELAAYLQVKPSSVHDMLKRLRNRGWINYQKYGKISLNESGRALAVGILRKHRLWETFLHDTLGFSWDEVHEVAEQLEHIQSAKLIDRLDFFLGYPKVDPHGDYIPDADGHLEPLAAIPINQMETGEVVTLLAVKGNDPTYLQYLSHLEIRIGIEFKLIERVAFDGSLVIEYKGKRQTISRMTAEGLLVSRNT